MHQLALVLSLIPLPSTDHMEIARTWRLFFATLLHRLIQLFGLGLALGDPRHQRPWDYSRSLRRGRSDWVGRAHLQRNAITQRAERATALECRNAQSRAALLRTHVDGDCEICCGCLLEAAARGSRS